MRHTALDELADDSEVRIHQERRIVNPAVAR